MKKLTLRTKFKLGTGIILFITCLSVSLLVYKYEKRRGEEAAYKETEIYIAAVEATRTYVKDVLRPQMYKILPEDHFVVEAMSTSFVGREIMGRIADRFYDFRYKRVSPFPLNRLNHADEYEIDVIQKFNEDRSIREWAGIIQKNGKSYYTRYRAIYAEPECLRCHGHPADAPPSIISKYHISGDGYTNRIGEAIATDAVYIPVDFILAKLKKRAWAVFIVGSGLLFSLTFLFYVLFNHTVISELKGLLSSFASIGSSFRDSHVSAAVPEIDTLDEIGQLKAAFEKEVRNLRETHEKLGYSEIKYRRLFETSRDPIFIADLDQKMVDINKAGMQLFEFTDRSEALSIEMIDQLFWDARDLSRLQNHIKENGFAKDYEISVVNRHGKRLDVLVTANLRVDDQGNLTGFEGSLRDITERKRLEKQLAQTERLASIGQLAAGVAHEINNPLGVIKCYTDLIKKSANLGSQILTDLKMIDKHTKICQKIVNDLLLFSRSTEPQEVSASANIHDGLTEVLRALDQQLMKRHIEVQRKFDQDVPMINADIEKLKQVYLNLIMNAIQSMENDGRITIETAFLKGKNTVVTLISDTGGGIPLKSLDRIFDPFFSTKKPGEGTGLGLSISYGIIRDHGGKIEVESTPGKGSTFTITLPVDRNSAQ
jgi:PAS domain S-box-containing protein